MAIGVSTAAGTGKIIRKDTEPDGTEIWLVCERAEGPDSSNGTAVGLLPDDEDIYPLAGARPDEAVSDTLIVDTSALSGTVRFRLATFANKALRALKEGFDEVEISETNAREWGLMSPLARGRQE